MAKLFTSSISLPKTSRFSISWIQALRGLSVLAGVLLMAAIVFSPYIPQSITLKEGETAKRTITSPRNVTFESSEDQMKTAALRNERVGLVKEVYTIDEEINKTIVSDLLASFTALKEVRETVAKESAPDADDVSLIAQLDPNLLAYAKAMPQNVFTALEYVAVNNIEKLLAQGLRDVVTQNISKQVKANTRMLDLTRADERLVFELIISNLTPNLVYNDAQTQQRIKNEIASIKPFTTSYREGEPIIYENETVLRKHIEALQALNIYGTQANFFKFMGIALFIGMLFVLMDRFMFYFSNRFHGKIKYYLLIYIVMLIIVVFARGFYEMSGAVTFLDARFLIPISISSMVLSLLITPNISLISGSLIAIFVSMMFQADFGLFLYLFTSNCVATFAIYKKYNRAELMSSGYIVGAFNVAVVFALALFQEAYDPLWFGTNFLVAFFNGVLSAMISLAILPYFERFFAITTQQSLLELANLNHPLLKKMMMTAPGTYQHSLMVANLAEAAAEAIHADPVMCRVGGFFHDIGKMRRPLFFVENQFSGENPHNTLSPRMSKMIIASHPKDGLEMAKKYKLPKVVQDFIVQHHGTTLVGYFYNQALQTEDLEASDASKDDFRYAGPKPQFKESGILMLADSVEAAVRSLEKPTPAKIETMVNKIFASKLEDRQLDECPISLKEVEQVRQTLLKVLQSMYHNRIEYKDELLQNKDNDGQSDT